MDLVDDLGRDDEATPALRWFAKVPIDFARAAQAHFGGLADIALAMPMADAYIHAAYDTQLRIVVNCN